MIILSPFALVLILLAVSGSLNGVAEAAGQLGAGILKLFFVLALVLGPALWLVSSYGAVAVKGLALIAAAVVGVIIFLYNV
jgi:hypothetical protein